MISEAQARSQKRYYMKNREALIMQTKMRKSGVLLPLAECRRIVAATAQETGQ